MSLFLELQGILTLVRLLTEVPGALGELVDAIEKLIAKEEDPFRKHELDMQLAVVKTKINTEVA